MHFALGRRPAISARPARPIRPARPRHPERTGTEPRTALSDLPARRLLAGIFGPVYAAGAVLFSLMAAAAKPTDTAARNTWIGFAAVCALLAVIAAVDLVVIHARMAAERRAGLAWRHDRPWVMRGDVVARTDERPEQREQLPPADPTDPTGPPTRPDQI